VQIKAKQCGFKEACEEQEEDNGPQASVSVHLGSVCAVGSRKVSGQKTSYHVTCHQAEADDILQTWLEATEINCEDYSPTLAEELMEPLVIFKKYRAGVTIVLVVSDPMECCEDNMVETVKDSSDICEENARMDTYHITYDTVDNVSQLQTHNCPAKTEKKIVKEREELYSEIRPLVRLFRKTSPDPPQQHFSEPEPSKHKEKPELDSPADISKYRRKYSHTETPKSSIKFSTSTALYTPPKPSLQNYAKPDSSFEYGKQTHRGSSLARSSLFSTYNLTARARSEFRERSIPVGRRSYVSLYS